MASLTFTTNINTTIDSSEALIDITVSFVSSVPATVSSSEILLQLDKDVFVDGLSAYLVTRNIQPILVDGLSARIILVPPTYNYYRIAATTYNIEPPEEPS